MVWYSSFRCDFVPWPSTCLWYKILMPGCEAAPRYEYAAQKSLGKVWNFILCVTMQAFDGVRLPCVIAHPYTVHSTASSHHLNVLTSNCLIHYQSDKQELGSHWEGQSLIPKALHPAFGNLHTASQRLGGGLGTRLSQQQHDNMLGKGYMYVRL